MMQPTSQPQHPWDQFKDLKDEAYLYIDQGLRLEQTSKPDRVSSDRRLTQIPIHTHSLIFLFTSRER